MSYRRPNATRPENGFSLLESLPADLFWALANQILLSQTNDFALCRGGTAPRSHTGHADPLRSLHETEDVLVTGVAMNGFLYVTALPSNADRLNPDGTPSLFANENNVPISQWRRGGLGPSIGNRLVRDGEALRMSWCDTDRDRVYSMFRYAELEGDVHNQVFVEPTVAQHNLFNQVFRHQDSNLMPIEGSNCVPSTRKLLLLALNKTLAFDCSTNVIMRLPILARLDPYLPPGKISCDACDWFACVPITWIDQFQNGTARRVSEFKDGEKIAHCFLHPLSQVRSSAIEKVTFSCVQAMLVASFFCKHYRFVCLNDPAEVKLMVQNSMTGHFQEEYSATGRHVDPAGHSQCLRIPKKATRAENSRRSSLFD